MNCMITFNDSTDKVGTWGGKRVVFFQNLNYPKRKLQTVLSKKELDQVTKKQNNKMEISG